MNERIKKLAVLSYSEAQERCRQVNHHFRGDGDPVFIAFSMNQMYNNSVKECIQKLIDHGYDDAAKCLTEEVKDV